MARLLGVSISLLAVLGLIWVCCGNGLPSASGSTVPQFQQKPSETEPTQPTEPPTRYDPIAGAMLVARSLLPYDGPALWDEEGELSGVAALELWNAGDQTIRYAEILVWQGQKAYTFTVTYIPPGGHVIVPEKNRSPYTREAVTEIEYAVVVPMEEVPAAAVSVTEDGVFTLHVTNATLAPLSCVRVFYKQYDAQRDAYIGAMTYSAVINGLGPGETKMLVPYGYVSGYARVVAVVAETEKGVA